MMNFLVVVEYLQLISYGVKIEVWKVQRRILEVVYVLLVTRSVS
jgi:hypothetical protein